MHKGFNPFTLQQGLIQYLPVVPGRLEFAEEVRNAILVAQPQVVAVELPFTLEKAFQCAMARLPELSVIIFEDSEQDRTVYLPVEITDPFVEAIRTAQEIGAEVFFVDPDVGQPSQLDHYYPDTFAVRRLGVSQYVENFWLYSKSARSEMQRHAAGIAWKLQGLDPDARVLAVISLNLLKLVLIAMETPQSEPITRLRREEVAVYNLHPDCLAEVLVEAPLIQAVYETRRFWIPDEIEPEKPPEVDPLQVGEFTVFPPGKPAMPSEQLELTIQRLASRCNWRKEEGSEKQQNQLAEALEIVTLHEEKFRLVAPMDRQRFNFHLWAEAERQYEINTGGKVAHWQRRLGARYSRNLALIDKMLVAGPFDLTIAARAVVDDNFAWEIWTLISNYPYQRADTDLPTLNITGEEVWIKMKRVQLHRRLPKKKTRPCPVGLRPRKKESYPGEWARQFDGNRICSYPPEDLVLENYGLFLKKKGKSILSEERSRVEPFTSSLLDGIDLRETLRNWHEGKLYVKEFQKIAGEVGAVVVIFNEDPQNHFNWGMTWLGEHSQESDMAFYSTDPANHIIGPGIARAEYGGFLLSYPPRRMIDVWHDPDYCSAESKAETLLLAALDYTLQRFVVYVAARPPRSFFKTIASRMDRKIIYIPMGQLSPVSLKKIRFVHILDNHETRSIAKGFIS